VRARYATASTTIATSRGMSGFSAGTGATLEKLNSMLAPLAVDKNPFDLGSPPRASHFVKPKVVAEFEFVEWTRGGQLRAPAFKGFRNDKNPREVVREGG
jgi:bifunctional non-homologous end joining protein LigD